jgi:hypothetical protein
LEDIPDLDTVLEKPEVLLKFIHYLWGGFGNDVKNLSL